MFRHIIGPNGDIRGMRNHLGQDAKGDEIIVHESPLPISMAGDFGLFLSNNQLPNGRTNPIPALTSEEFRLLRRPYNEWAPAPFNNNSNVGDSAINLFMVTFSGMEDIFDFETVISGGGFEGLSFIDHELQFNKMRAWGGLVPISDRRWREKGLDHSFLKAIGHLENTSAFVYFNIPAALNKIRKTYNRAYDRLDQFDRILSAHYARQPSHLQPNPLAARGKAADLWTEFFFSQIQFMTARALSWYTNHVNKLHDNIVDEFKKAPPFTLQLSPEQETTMQKLETIVDHRVKADLTILVSLTGFKNHLPHWRHLSSPPTPPHPRNFPPGYPATGAADLMTSNPEPALRLGWQTKDQTRDEFRGGPPTPIVEELWISRLRARLQLVKYTSWGFVAYRLDHSHTADQWLIFQELFKSEVTNWGEGVLGHEHIKSQCKIQWLDGRDYNIPENDIAAARKHFKSLRDTKSCIIEGLLTPDAFLVADSFSVHSFLHPPSPRGQESVDAADMPPFITIAQSQPFDAAVAAQDKESPGYYGHLWVAGSVLFDDVWAALFMRLYELKAMWNIAAVHPGGLYLGPYADYQKALWGDFSNKLNVDIMNEATNGRGGNNDGGR